MGKFGNAACLTAAEVWAAAARTLTDMSAEEIFDLPELDSGYSGVVVQSSGTAHTFGSWGEGVADVGAGKRLIGIMVGPLWAATASYGAEIEAGEGEGGSEAAITRVPVAGYWNTLGAFAGVYIPVYRSLSDNARLSFRVKDSASSALNYWCLAVIA